MNLKFVPITTNEKDMKPYLELPFCVEIFNMFKGYYPKVGFQLPWVGYFALLHDEVVGVGGFKGIPKDNRIEIGYGTVPGKEGNGYAKTICGTLVKIALEHDPFLRITARTLMEENASTTILKNNGFKFIGVVNDPEDGNVWEWEYEKPSGQ